METLAVTKHMVLCWLVVELVLMHTISAQDVFSGTTSRVIGNGVFSRACRYSGGGSIDHMEWLLNGITIRTGVTGRNEITLTILNPEANYAGNYSCLVEFTNGTNQSASAGSLVLYTEQSISVLDIQQVVEGSDIELQCSSNIPGTSIRFSDSDNSPLASATLHEVNLDQQGKYNCLVIDLTAGGNNIYTTKFALQVIVPPKIISMSSVKETYGNEQETFTVHFRSSPESDTTITWQLNNVPLTSTNQKSISTDYTSDTLGNTSLSFLTVNRADRGIYTVLIDNSMTLIPVNMRNTRISFTLNVHVPPTPPTTPAFEVLNNTHLRISWNLTNVTADAGPQYLIANIQDYPDSPINLDPIQNQLIIITEPGVSYNVTISAINADSSASSQPVQFTIPPQAPLVDQFATVVRVNETTFNFTLEVLYTGAGGGDLTLINIMFREMATNSSIWIQHGTDVDLICSPYSSLIWHALVRNSKFAAISDVEFSFTVRNIMNLEVQFTAQEMVVPGIPENVSAINVTTNSFTLRARLSTIGTSPITAAHFVITGPSRAIIRNVTENLYIGGLVEVDVEGLSTGTSYSVVAYATNSAGRGQSSMKKSFSTLVVASVLPLWIILVIAIVGSLVVVLLLLLLLISCCCRRNNNGKINLSSSLQRYEVDRSGPLTAAGSIDSIHTGSNYCYTQKCTQDFVLAPPPCGPHQSPLDSLSPSHCSPTRTMDQTSTIGIPAYNKSHLQSSPLESVISEQSSKYNHFNFRHSPLPSYINIGEYSRSMPILDDPDLSPTMPPNCITDV